MSNIDNIKNIDNSKVFQTISDIVTKTNNVKQSNENDEKKQAPSADRQPSISVDEAFKILKEKLEKLSKLFRGEAEFTFDRDIDRVIIKIKDKDTGEIIRQIPPEVAVKIAKKVDELLGILFDELA